MDARQDGPSQFEIDSNACPALPASDADPDAFLAAYNAQKQCMDRAEAAEQRREDREDAAWSALGGVGAGLQNTGAAMMPNPSDYTLSTQPPSAPTPSPLPDLGYTVNQARHPLSAPRTAPWSDKRPASEARANSPPPARRDRPGPSLIATRASAQRQPTAIHLPLAARRRGVRTPVGERPAVRHRSLLLGTLVDSRLIGARGSAVTT